MVLNAERITNHPQGDDQILYFTGPSLDRDGRRLWFISDRDGHPNILVQDLASGAVRPLTANRSGRLWQYQGFSGTPNRGLGVWSVALDPDRALIYHIQDDEIRCADAEGATRVLAKVPAGQTTAFIHVSDCGRWLCVPTTDERALLSPVREGCAPGGMHAIDRRCQDEGLNSFLRVYDTASGRLEACVAVPRCWITHVQFRPGRPEHILYNHEWPSAVGVRRMWLWDGARHVCLRPAGPGLSPEDWACHEVWSASGDAVIYHGGLKDGPAMVGRLVLGDGRRREISLPTGWKRYGHFQVAPSRDDLLVCDGYYEQPDDEPGKARWIALVRVDWDSGRLDWTPLVRHRSNWRDQDDHPHPIFSPDARSIYFTGGTPEGRRAVFRCLVPAG